MGDEFGTVSVRRAERAREMEILRQHYREHRDSLAALAENAPTDFLATEYQRLISEIDTAIGKLEELEGHPGDAPQRPKTQPGTRPIVHSPSVGADAAAPRTYVSSTGSAPSTQSRMILMVVVGLLVLGLIGYLIWRAGGDRRKPVTPVVEQPTTSVIDTAADTTIAPVTPVPPTQAPASTSAVPAEVANSVMITPALADYGTVRKGTRATRQFQVINTTATPVAIKVTRSGCRCLYYEYADRLAPKKKETITVTIDGARAKPGQLQETIQITGKSGTPVLAQFQVQATVK